MRIYNSLEDAYEEIKRELKEMGIRYISQTVQDQQVDIPTKELIGYSYQLVDLDWTETSEYVEFQGYDLAWLSEESINRVTYCVPLNPNPGATMNMKLWKPFMRDGCLAYTYPERMNRQVERIKAELNNHPNTRQAVITIYDQHQDLMNLGGRDRVPCSMYYQILIRGNKLHLMYTMRSCDFHKFFLADVMIALMMMNYLAKYFHKDLGSFTHFLGSLHAFESDLEEVF